MYGGPVPALAELVANAWDADAKVVDLRLPLDAKISGDEIISIRDDGTGMSWEDVASKYLVIGRNKRTIDFEITKIGRHVMGRKGIGKLAGFGIAKIVEIRTVRNKWVTHFAMDFDQMTSDSAAHARYEPQIIADEKCSEPNSTTVFLKKLTVKRAIPGQQFKESLSRRFAVFDTAFKLRINGKLISKSEMPTLLRFPITSGTLAEETVAGFGPVRYWYGFTRYPITESDARGLSLMVRGRMARPPSMFDISGGIWNQQALEYLTGEIYADALDDGEDYISTDRQSVNWTEDQPAALQAWAQGLIRRAARSYADDKAQILRHDSLSYLEPVQIEDIDQRLSALPPNIRVTADRLMSSFASATNSVVSSVELAQATRAIVQLSEDAAGGTSHDGSALLYSLVAARKNVIASARNIRSANTRYNLLRSNPWLLVSPWRIAVEDAEITSKLTDLKRSRPQLRSLKLWAIRHESRRYLIAYGADAGRIRQTLSSLARDVEATIFPTKVSFIVLVTPDKATVRGANVRIIAIHDLFAQAEKSCNVLVDLLQST